MPDRGTIEDQVSHEVGLWMRWLPRWHPGTHRTRRQLCRHCFGSPVLRAAGLDGDAPHGVQHAFSMRMKGIIDREVERYTEQNLPNLSREIQATEARKALRNYRAGDGLDPEHAGLELDPEPEPGQPFLFTLAELDHADAQVNAEPPPPLSEEEKQALRAELALADEHAQQIGGRVCHALAEHRDAIRAALNELVEPQIAELMADLGRELDSPSWTELR